MHGRRRSPTRPASIVAWRGKHGASSCAAGSPLIAYRPGASRMASGGTFRDRRDAGRRLAAALTRFRDDAPVILALPRGGVPVAFEVARALTAPLDVLLVRKIGAPGHAELGLGAVVDGNDPQLVLNDNIVAMVEPPPGYIAAEERRQLAEIERRRRLYRGDMPAVDLGGRTAIVVDDGIA